MVCARRLGANHPGCSSSQSLLLRHLTSDARGQGGGGVPASSCYRTILQQDPAAGAHGCNRPDHAGVRACCGSTPAGPGRLPHRWWGQGGVGGAGLGYLPAGPSIHLARPPSRAGSHWRYDAIRLQHLPARRAASCTMYDPRAFWVAIISPKKYAPIALTTHMTRDHDAIATNDHPPPMALLPETRVPFD